MMNRLRTYRPILIRAGIGLLLTLFVYEILYLLRWFFFQRLSLNSDLVFLSLWIVSYFLVAGLIWARRKLLWSLRNQMSAAYLLIAVVPVILLLTMVGLTAYLLYWQLGSYVLYTQVQTRVQRVATVAGGLATTLAIQAAAAGKPVPVLPLPDQTLGFLETAKADIPGLQIDIGKGEDLLAETGSTEATGFAGIVLTGRALALRAVQVRTVANGTIKEIVSVSAPITPELLDTLAPELGPIRLFILQPLSDNTKPRELVTLNGEKLDLIERIATKDRTEPRAANIFDQRIDGITTLNLVDLGDERRPKGEAQLHALFTSRPSLLNRRLFAPLGPMGTMAVNLLLTVGMIFLAIELAALIAGIILTRAITTSVDNLYLATRHAQSGDLSFRVPLRQRDELGALGDSFNSMMQSVSTLIEEQRERHRLENELAIAREVQTQLFPPELPSMPGVELEAICRPARMVSGDYYDFIRIGPTRLAIVLADISGKGISAALLMASLQATLRGELLRDVENNPNPGREPFIPNTAQIVAHLNRHLFLSTSEERYATLFLAIYDTRTRRLSYTNAGHLPPFYLHGDSMQRLETNDTVIGLFSDVEFRQSTLTVAPDGLLVIYSDGLTEPENGAGEAFGASRLAEIAMRLRTESPRVVAQSMLSAAERWSVGRTASPSQAQTINSNGGSNIGSNSASNGGSSAASNSAPPAEQADDMTVVVARLSSPDLRADAVESSSTRSLIEN